ncbi:MAG: membrane-bound lytic murein transglycosylase MltF [Candidatus Electrothrix sp. Rat3]|nr:membrane-bound lytic murein transglycosylase MltF [Candidatus Electrothrix rattekaaiensis]
MKKKTFHRFFLTILSTGVFFAAFFAVVPDCLQPSGTLRDIRQQQKLRVIMTNNANVYYRYREEYMGFEYDLVRAFAEYLGVDLEIMTPEWDTMFQLLDAGKADLVAAGLTVTPSREALADFSDGHLEVQQQVIVHKSNDTLQELADLEGKIIHLRAGTSYAERIREFREDGYALQTVLHRNLPTEELIRQVAIGEIEATVADSNIALLNQRYYPDMRISFPIEEVQTVAWAVRTGETELLNQINTFFELIKENGVFGRIYERYYRDVSIFDYVDLKKFHKRLKTRLPKYKHIIRKETKKYGFDWRMIVAVMYQESHFDPRARSHTGVRGLMQVTKATAREMGIRNRLDPAQSIRAGVGYLAKLYARFADIKDADERLLFALASYNIGYGHVRDAQKICRRKGWNHRRWAAMEKALPLLRLKRYYKDTEYGYARGTEPVRYIRRILLYFDIIKQKSREKG